jgi:Spy/CpxP family protein refolding chaperone
MNVKKRLIIITLIIAVLGAVPFAYAAPRHRGGRGLLGHLNQLRSELDLSDAQVEQIRSIARATREQNEGFRETMHGTFKDVAATLLTNPNDVAAAQTLLDRQAAAERQLKTNLLAAASKALNVLTPEQRTKLALHLAERGQRRENRRR